MTIGHCTWILLCGISYFICFGFVKLWNPNIKKTNIWNVRVLFENPVYMLTKQSRVPIVWYASLHVWHSLLNYAISFNKITLCLCLVYLLIIMSNSLFWKKDVWILIQRTIYHCRNGSKLHVLLYLSKRFLHKIW